MLLRPRIALLLPLAAVLAGCNGGYKTSGWNASNRPLARASTDPVQRVVQPIRLGAGDSLGQAVFAQYANSGLRLPAAAWHQDQRTAPVSALANR